MTFPRTPRSPGLPLSDGEVLIGRAFAFADHRSGFLPSELVATNRRIALSTPVPNLTAPIVMLVILWVAGVIFFVSGSFVLGGLTWTAGLGTFVAQITTLAPKRLEAFPLESVVLCTSENESNLFKALRITLVFASGARWGLRPNGGGLSRQRDYLASILRQAGIVVTRKT